jgi:RNA polymerase sigma factor (sigma-70 family)
MPVAAAISLAEYAALVKKAQEGDKKARDRVVLTLQPLVKATMKRALGGQRFRSSEEDLMQEGNVGVLKAIDHYNPEKGTTFITYAVIWIRCMGFEHIRSSTAVTVPSARDARRVLWRAGLNVTDAELADELKVSETLVHSVRMAVKTPSTIHTLPVREKSAVNPSVDPWERVHDELAAKEMRQAVEKLTDRLRILVTKRLEGKTLNEIRKHPKLRVTRQRVAQLEQQAHEQVYLTLVAGRR